MRKRSNEKEAWTYYCCRSEAVSKGLKAGALCNKPNKEVIDRSTGRFPPARTEAGALATARFSLSFPLCRQLAGSGFLSQAAGVLSFSGLGSA